jgi:uncharacterized repeat protein (TIGR03806 family)
MSSGRVLGLSAFAIFFAAIWACGGDEGGGGTPSDDGGDGGNGGDGAPPPPTRAEFGLDARPANPTCKAPDRPPSTAPVKFERVFDNVQLAAPMAMAQAPGDGSRWFVALRGGTLVTFPTTNPPNAPATVANLSTLSGNAVAGLGGEGGFLGMAIHPKFAQNGRIYVSWTDNAQGTGSMRSVIGYITSTDGGQSFTSYKEILAFDQTTATNHKGGGLAFGKDGYLYASFGDGGGGDDQFVKGQTKSGFFSKILRIDVDNPADGKPYGIPNGNPFKAGGGSPEVFAYGFRNPFRFSVDRETNEVWVGDVGQNQWEEIDAKVQAGGNYGWPCKEATHDYLNTNATKCPNPGATFIDPVVEHEHVPRNSRSITGGVVYRGKAMPAFAGTYVYGDYVKQELWSVTFEGGEAKSTRLNEAGPAANWVGFAEDVDGEVYALALNQGSIYKLLPAGPQPPDTFPTLLSKTGCVDPSDPTKPASGLVPYGVNSALWSDGAKKDRWMALPDGKTITVGPDGDFDFPNGTVLMKSFSVNGKLVETRLFMRHDDGGWAGYTYEWNDAQTDATLLRSSKTKAAGGQNWYYPSRSECVTCHSEAAGRSLGLELGQQNGDFVYTSTNRISNQLKTLEHIGMFSAPLGQPVDQIIAYPDPIGTAGTAEARARSYLHSNCSNCHRPKGPGGGDMDLRFATALKDTKTCDVDPQRGDMGVDGAKILAPGAPPKSVLSLRPHSPAANRMPPLATSVVDDKGVKVLDDWITSVTACPQ